MRLQGYQTCAGAGMLAPGVANAVLVQHLVLGGVRLQGYQTCAGTGMLAPGLANVVLVRFLVSDVEPDLLLGDFGSLLEKHLFLGRTLLLRFQGYQTCAGAGMLVPGLANAVLVQHSVLRVLGPTYLSISLAY